MPQASKFVGAAHGRPVRAGAPASVCDNFASRPADGYGPPMGGLRASIDWRRWRRFLGVGSKTMRALLSPVLPTGFVKRSPRRRRSDGGLEPHRGRPRYADRRADRLGQDAGRVSLGAERPGGTQPQQPARGPRACRLRLAAQGARQRHSAQSAGSAGRHPQRSGSQRPDAAGDPCRRAQRRHAGTRTCAAGEAAAAHPDHDAGVALTSC
jgi:hypothetical protein